MNNLYFQIKLCHGVSYPTVAPGDSECQFQRIQCIQPTPFYSHFRDRGRVIQEKEIPVLLCL